MKHLLTEWPPLSSRGLCGIAGAAALALFALARRQKLSVPRPMWLRLLLVSMLTIGGWVAFMGLALLWLNASEAAVLGISIPVWVALLAWPILGERLSPLRAVALTVALAGIAVLIGGNGLEASVEKLPGIACALAGAVCVGLGTVLTSISRWRCRRCRWPPGRSGSAARRSRSLGLRSSSRNWLRCHRRLGVAAQGDADRVLPCCAGSPLERLPAATARSNLARSRRRGAAAAAMLHEPLGLREIAALVFTRR